MDRNRFYNSINEAIEAPDGWYGRFMFGVISVSLIPLFFKGTTPVLRAIDWITVTIFIVDYVLRWITAPLRDKSRGFSALFVYPFTPFAIIDLLTILPSFTPVYKAFKVLKLLRVARTLRAFKLLRYSKSFNIIVNVIKREKEALGAVGVFAFAYVLISALVMFQVEPDSFGNFFDAFYWAAVTLTTVGYGDIYPVSTLGRAFSVLSSFIGIAIVALPTGIITAGYMNELNAR